MKSGILKKTVFLLGIAVCVLTVAVLASGYHVKNVGRPFIIAEVEELQPAPAVLVLGARVYPDGRVSLMLQDRLETGLKVYLAGKADKILLSGDNGQEHYNEVRAMKNYLLGKGVLEEDIFMDHAGFSTYDSLYRARDVFLAEELIIATQEYHLYRALYLGHELGLKVSGVPADINHYPNVRVKNAVREVLARAKSFYYARVLKPAPRYLGPEIPLTGDGRVTEEV